jgi:hypothetical protein
MTLVIPWFYVPLLLYVAVIQILLRYPSNTPVPIPGLSERCDRATSCSPAQRTNYDATFLCCEDATYWPASHILAPMWFTIVLGSPWLGLLGVSANDAIEALVITITGSYGIFPSDPANRETAAGSWVGDVVIQGTLGVLLGALIMSYSGYPGILPFVWREGAVQRWSTATVTAGVTWKYFLVLVLTCAPFLVAGSSTSAGTLYGPYITLGLLALALFVFSPWLLRPTDVPLYNMRALHWRMAPIGFVVSLVISLGALEWFTFLANNYFAVWFFYYIATLLVFVAAWLFPNPPSTSAKVRARARAKPLP